MRPRLLLFDLDGTLLDSTRTMRPANVTALTDAMQRGLRVGFATGRSPVSVRRFVDELSPSGPLILFNGCALWDPQTDRALAARTLPPEDALRLVQATLDVGVHANVYIGQQLFVARRGELSVQSERKDGVPHIEVPDLVEHVRTHSEPVTKLLCIQPEGQFDALSARFREVLRSDCTLVRSEPTYLEVLPPGVSKAAMLPEIEAQFGISAEEVVMFGDELNDLELLQAAGRAVVMGNGNPEIIAVADDVIGSNDTDAIADYVRTL